MINNLMDFIDELSLKSDKIKLLQSQLKIIKGGL